jgi:hypothetical protein
MAKQYKKEDVRTDTVWDEDEHGFCTYVLGPPKYGHTCRPILFCSECHISEIETQVAAEKWITENTIDDAAKVKKKPR